MKAGTFCKPPNKTFQVGQVRLLQKPRKIPVRPGDDGVHVRRPTVRQLTERERERPRLQQKVSFLPVANARKVSTQLGQKRAQEMFSGLELPRTPQPHGRESAAQAMKERERGGGEEERGPVVHKQSVAFQLSQRCPSAPDQAGTSLCKATASPA